MSRRTVNLLPQVSFSIMLALSLRPRHGYEIMQQVEIDSAGRQKLGPGALYGTIKQLVEAGLIKEVPPSSKVERRRFYELTKKGRGRLGADLEYFETTVRLGQQRKIMGDTIWAR